MVVDHESFTQLAVHVRRASDSLLTAAREMTDLSEVRAEHDLGNTVDALLRMNQEFVVLERLLRAIWEANRSETTLSN